MAKRNIAGMAGLALAMAGLALGGLSAQPMMVPTQWTDWGGDAARSHYSSLNQITAANVGQLKPAWVWDGGTFGRSWEITPLLIDGVLIVCESGSGDVLGIVPESGKELWRHKAPTTGGGERRGFAYWDGDGAMKPRIVSIWGHMMYGIDPKTGASSIDWPVTGLDIGLPNPANGGAIGGGVFATSPPIIYKNLIITAGASGFLPPPAQPSDPHANDLRTGKLVWTARLIPGTAEPGGASWGSDTQSVVGSGSWGILALDAKTGTVYVPTDSGSPDYVGIWRPGDNAGADATFALDALTGKIKWGFQNHRHDIFDLDTNAAPTPVEVSRDGEKQTLVVQSTKQGMLWIIDDKTGKPAFPYEERPVAQSKIAGEKSAPTQPFTILPQPLMPQTVQREHLSTLSQRSNDECKALYDANGLEDGTPFGPPRPNGAWTIMSIGATGGVDWGGVSIDRDHGNVITNITNMPTMITATKSTGAFNNGVRSTSGNVRFVDKGGRSCNGGRQGELVSVSLTTGKIAWRVPLGTLEDEFGPGVRDMGATNIGPSLVTHGGIVFIGAATDGRLHAHDSRTGKLLWQAKMSASANAGPMTYMGKDGRQYVVIAAGGPGNARRPSERDNVLFHQTLVAFALPRPGDKPLDIVAPYPARALAPGETMATDSAGGATIVTGGTARNRGGAE